MQAIQQRTPNVLIVDDDKNLVAGLMRILHHEPFRIASCPSGESALELMRNEMIDVLVTDESMPGMSGTDLVTTVRREHPAIVSIMLSGQASMGSVIRSLNQGEIYRFLIKPCSHTDLATSIKQALRYKLVLDYCRDMLPTFRLQSAVIALMEARFPEILLSLRNEVATKEQDDAVRGEAAQALANRFEADISHVAPADEQR